MKIIILFKIISLFIIVFLGYAIKVESITDSNPSNNVMSINVTVIETTNLSIDFIPIDNKTSTFSVTIDNNTQFLNLTYPLSDTGFQFRTGDEIFESQVGITLIEDEKCPLLKNLYKRGRISKNVDRVVGVVNEGWFISHGQGNLKGYSCHTPLTIFKSVIFEEGFRHTAAHELGHTFGLCDEYNNNTWYDQDNLGLISGLCPNGDSNPNDGQLDSSCIDESQGCDTTALGKLITYLNQTGDISLFNFMGSSNNNTFRWITNDSYKHLLNKLSSPVSFLSVDFGILISGIVYKNGSIDLDNAYVLNEKTILKENSSGNYSISIVSNTTDLFNISFNATFKIINIGGNLTETNVSAFAFVLPFSSNVTKIVVRQDTIVKAEKNKTPNIPTLNLTFPIGNEIIHNKMNVTYNASDVDGDIINYAILISADNGNTFSTLEMDYINKTLFVNTSSLSDGKQYKVKVLATDGINTNTTISQNTFEVDNDLRITNLSTRLENDTRRVFFHKTKNTLENRINNITETFDTGESVISLSQNYSLNGTQEMFVFIEYNYTSRGDKTITSTASSGSYVETESTSINLPDIEVFNLSILNITNMTKIVFRFKINNTLSVNMTNVSWTFDTNNSNIINSTSIFVLEPSKIAFVYMHYNFTTTGTFNVNATARNGTLTDSRNLTITI